MKNFRPLTIAILIMAAVFLSACVGYTPQSGYPEISVNQGTAYLAHGSFVYAVNVTNGTMLWKFPPAADATKTFYAAPVLTADGKQLIVSAYGNVPKSSALYSIDPASGKELWSFPATGQTAGIPTDRFIGSPLVVNQTIYAPNADWNLYALDSSGKPVSGFSFKANGPLWSTPATDGKCNCLYVSSMDHNVYSLDIGTGRVLWSHDLGSAVVGTPAISPDGGTLYVGNFSSQMFALNAKNNGAVIGQPVALKGWVWSGPVLKGDTLYFGDLNGNFYTLKTGGSTYNSVQPDNSIVAAPLITDKGIYFTVEGGQVYAVDQNLKTLWNPTIGGTMYSTPVQAGDLILVTPVGIDPVLVALDSNGAQRWQFIPPK